MTYHAPRLHEVGTVDGLTLGRTEPGPKNDNTAWGYAGKPFNTPPAGPKEPVGSR